MEQRPIEDLNFLQISHNSSNHRQLYQCNNNKLSTIAHWIEQNVQKTCNLSNNSAINANKSPTTTSKRVVSTSSSGKRDKISTNRLGGIYSTGRPLPMEIREKIVELAKSGLKPCQISKELRVSHGCVSKLLTKWRKTGTVKPEKIGGSRPKKVLPSVARAITVYKHYRPRLQSWQIKEYLIKDGICTDGNVPSISSINKTLRNQRRVKSTNPEMRISNESCGRNSTCCSDQPTVKTSSTSNNNVRQVFHNNGSSTSQVATKQPVLDETINFASPTNAFLPQITKMLPPKMEIKKDSTTSLNNNDANLIDRQDNFVKFDAQLFANHLLQQQSHVTNSVDHSNTPPSNAYLSQNFDRQDYKHSSSSSSSYIRYQSNFPYNHQSNGHFLVYGSSPDSSMDLENRCQNQYQQQQNAYQNQDCFAAYGQQQAYHIQAQNSTINGGLCCGQQAQQVSDASYSDSPSFTTASSSESSLPDIGHLASFFDDVFT